jgi:hypothetical protein
MKIVNQKRRYDNGWEADVKQQGSRTKIVAKWVTLVKQYLKKEQLGLA